MSGTSTDGTTKFCKDCKHSHQGLLHIVLLMGHEYDKCRNPKVAKTRTDLVSGETRQKVEYCSVARNYDHLCGEEGKHYERS